MRTSPNSWPLFLLLLLLGAPLGCPAHDDDDSVGDDDDVVGDDDDSVGDDDDSTDELPPPFVAQFQVAAVIGDLSRGFEAQVATTVWTFTYYDLQGIAPVCDRRISVDATLEGAPPTSCAACIRTLRLTDGPFLELTDPTGTPTDCTPEQLPKQDLISGLVGGQSPALFAQLGLVTADGFDDEGYAADRGDVLGEEALAGILAEDGLEFEGGLVAGASAAPMFNYAVEDVLGRVGPDWYVIAVIARDPAQNAFDGDDFSGAYSFLGVPRWVGTTLRLGEPWATWTGVIGDDDDDDDSAGDDDDSAGDDDDSAGDDDDSAGGDSAR